MYSITIKLANGIPTKRQAIGFELPAKLSPVLSPPPLHSGGGGGLWRFWAFERGLSLGSYWRVVLLLFMVCCCGVVFGYVLDSGAKVVDSFRRSDGIGSFTMFAR